MWIVKNVELPFILIDSACIQYKIYKVLKNTIKYTKFGFHFLTLVAQFPPFSPLLLPYYLDAFCAYKA